MHTDPGLRELVERVRRLEDIEAIRNLKALYSHYCDTGWDGAGSNAEAATQLFAIDGVYDTPMTGRLIGHAAIREMMEGFGLRLGLALHVMANPHIEVEGDRGYGTWHGLNALLAPDGRALWSGGIYEEEYVRTAAGWRFQLIRRRSAFLTPYEDGWGRVRDVSVSVKEHAEKP